MCETVYMMTRNCWYGSSLDQVSPLEFNPCNSWEEGESTLHGNPFTNNLFDEQRYVQDRTSGIRYSKGSGKRADCLALAVVTPIVQLLPIAYATVIRIIKLVTFAHFWMPSPEGNWQVPLTKRLSHFGKDLLLLALTPILLVGLELSAIYGCIASHHGAKLYSACERALLGYSAFAPCFSPIYPGEIAVAIDRNNYLQEFR